MPRVPYMNFSFPFYRNYSRIPSYYPPIQTHNNSYNVSSSYKNENYTSNINPDSETSRDFKQQKNKSNKNNDNYLFDLFGLKIFQDDVLLVSLIYFLYSEGVKDDGLFIVLILLLLS